MGISGTSPGILLGDNRSIPINYDGVAEVSLFSPALLQLQNSQGLLASQGQATVTWNIPNFPFLAGLNVFGSFVTISPGQPLPALIVDISPAINFTLVL